MRLQLQHENGNNADYAHLLFSNLENYSSRSPSAPQYFVNRRISKAFHFFCNRLNTESAEGLDKTLRLYNTVMQASIVQILVKDSTAALTLFESLNNRGVALSVVDVIKSHLFTSNSLKNQNNTEIVEDNLNRRWADILKLLGDDYQVHERFFRHNYNAFRTDWTLHIGKSVDENGNYPLGNLATKYSLDRIYRDIFTSCHSIMETIDLITEHAKLYQNILASDPESKTPFHIYYLSLARVQGSTSYLLLLYLEKNRKLLELKDETIIRIIKLITAFFVRRNLTDVPATRDLNKIFINIIESIMELNLVGSAVFDKIKLQLTNTLPPEEEFAEALRGDLYADNQNLTSFILRSLADSKKTKEEASSWDFKSNHSSKSDR